MFANATLSVPLGFVARNFLHPNKQHHIDRVCERDVFSMHLLTNLIPCYVVWMQITIKCPHPHANDHDKKAPLPQVSWGHVLHQLPHSL